MRSGLPPRGLSPRHRRMSPGARIALATGAMMSAAAAPQVAEDAWTTTAQDALAATCAGRRLDLLWPVRVRPMAEYGAGYTAGVGSITWAADHAEAWRAGWCALGVFCARSAKRAGPGGDGALARPDGLYSHVDATIYVRDPGPDAATAATVAHEAVHALQAQHFPHLAAAHLWFNRDLNAAVESVAEGDAHLVGWSFTPARRRHLCSMDRAEAARLHREWWRWQPHGLTALEGFPHVFGPELLLGKLLDDPGAADALLRDPPLSTLAVLRPERAGPVEFIALPDDLAAIVSAETGKRCAAGLANTAGVVGIWGLLALADEAIAGELPDFLLDWAGDRFTHLPCEDDDGAGPNDELVWLTAWRSADAAQMFARHFESVATAAARRGGVLAAPAQALAHGRRVLVTTPGARGARKAVLASEARALDDYRGWIDSGCFPRTACQETPAVTARLGPGAGLGCGAAPTSPSAMTDWLARIRSVRNAASQPDDLSPALAAAAENAVFCALNGRRNADLRRACRAWNFGVRFLATIVANPHWRWLPLCASASAYQAQLRAWLRPSGGDAPDIAREARVRAAARVATAFAQGRGGAVAALAAAPPLSSLHLLDERFQGLVGVDFLALPSDALAAAGCELLATDVVGVSGLWSMLGAGDAAALPEVLRAWRGDRQWYVRCGPRDGWLWALRWADEAAAKAFAVAFERSYEDASEVRGRTVWFAPRRLADAKAVAQRALRSQTFTTFNAWKAAGCYPQTACRSRRADALTQPAPAR